MANQPGSEMPAADDESIPGSMADIAERCQRLVTESLTRKAAAGASADPFNIGNAFLEMTARMMSDPAKMVQAQMSLWQDYLGLWQSTAGRMLGQETAPAATPEAGDRRFRDKDWDENAVFDFIKQSYLLTARWIQATVEDVHGLDDETARKVEFFTRQFVNALSPSNFVMTNPEVLRATIESRGENLVRGLGNMLEDLERGDGRLAIKMTDLDAFQVGGNIAVTPGKVVFRTDLMELIQYDPATPKVRRRPLLIMPPWINKFYILDLRPENSLIKWAVDQGHTVFVVSWVNPDEALAEKTFDDYMVEGPLAAFDAIEKATGEARINAVGYCVGGTLLACTLAYMAARGDERIVSATFLAAMVDFAEAGELAVFIDEVQVARLEERMKERGYLEGREMAASFNMMRDNDLIWSFVVNNYLLGKDPFPFDLLYWNADTTRIPAAMHGFYLRKMYMENKLVTPGGISLAGVPIDLGKIKTPAYVLSARDDHIVPWKSTFAHTRLYSGPVRFMLAASGHIAGIVNPPAADKYCHWINAKMPKNPDAWLEGATRHEGSWWPDWGRWLTKHAGQKTVAARVPGDGGLTVIGDAPGEYVQVRDDTG